MGKIRIKTLGDENLEQQEKKELKIKREQKKTRLAERESRRMAKAPGLKGGERVVSVGPSEEEIEKLVQAESTKEEKQEVKEEKKAKKEKFKTKARQRSKSYLTSKQAIDKSKKYSVSDALNLLEKIKRAKFDETVELHVNATKTGVLGTVMLPHGTGKKVRVAIADEAMLEKIEKGIVDFDVLLATPELMPKLARVARILGPRGLMPNPKNGTISKNPKEAAKQFESGQLTIKTEGKFPIAHITLGKISFGEKKLAENVDAVVGAISAQNIQQAVLKSTMSPAIKLQI